MCAGRQRIGGDAACRGVDPLAGGERAVEGRGQLRLDADEIDPPGIPGGDAADQPAAAEGDEQGIEIGRILLELEAEAALAEKGFRLAPGCADASIKTRERRARDMGLEKRARDIGVWPCPLEARCG
jgi:hypothetical protein